MILNDNTPITGSIWQMRMSQKFTSPTLPCASSYLFTTGWKKQSAAIARALWGIHRTVWQSALSHCNIIGCEWVPFSSYPLIKASPLVTSWLPPTRHTCAKRTTRGNGGSPRTHDFSVVKNGCISLGAAGRLIALSATINRYSMPDMAVYSESIMRYLSQSQNAPPINFLLAMSPLSYSTCVVLWKKKTNKY